MSLSETERKHFDTSVKETEAAQAKGVADIFKTFLTELEQALERKIPIEDGTNIASITDDKQLCEIAVGFLHRPGRSRRRLPWRREPIPGGRGQ